jgi:hypothetical protein
MISTRSPAAGKGKILERYGITKDAAHKDHRRLDDEGMVVFLPIKLLG